MDSIMAVVKTEVSTKYTKQTKKRTRSKGKGRGWTRIGHLTPFENIRAYPSHLRSNLVLIGGPSVWFSLPQIGGPTRMAYGRAANGSLRSVISGHFGAISALSAM